MTSEQWHRVKELFEAALELGPEERTTFLTRQCLEDEELRQEVQSLLAAHDADSGFMREPVGHLLTGNKPALLAGQRFGPYEVISPIGQGGMGQVYRGLDTRLRRNIALKLLPSSCISDAERVRRFEQEAQAASALNHPNIVTIHEIGQTDSLHFIATEFVEGETLRALITNRRITIADVLNIAIQIASALQAAHENGIVHRDIKPENIMLRRDGYVKVLDFGLAKLTEHSDTESISLQTELNTDPGMVMGTPRYMSPEQARGLEVDSRTDIFSLGIIIYEMVTGRVPFEGATPSDIIAALLKDEPESLSEIVPEAPLELEQVVNRALSKNRDERYATVGELSADLHQLKEGIQLNAKLGQISIAGPLLQKIGSETVAATRKFVSTNPQEFQQTSSLDTVDKKQSRAGFVIAALVITIVGIIAIALIKGRHTTPSSDQSARLSGRALTIRNGYITAARFAPDGKSVIYSAAFDGRPVELFAADLDGSESRPIGIPSAALKDISSTGEMAVLFDFELSWNEGRNGTLALVPSTGGEARVVIQGIDEATFAPDGKSLAVVRADIGHHQLEYPAGEVLYKSSGWISYPRFSRVGDKIAFFEHPVGDNSGSLMILDLKTKTTAALSTGWRALKGLAWSATGDALWFGGSKVGKKQNINAVSLSGQERLNIDEMASYSKLEDISAQGRLLISHGNTHTTIVTLSDDSKSEAPGTRFAWSTSADISSDGKTLLFYEWGWESGEDVEVKSTYLRRFDGSNPIRLGEGRALALSPDNNWALALQEKSPPQLALLPTGEGKATELPNPGFKEYHYGSWFPDGKRILFTAVEAREDSFLRSYIQDVVTGVVQPVTEEGTIALRVSPDGKKLVIRDPYGRYYLRLVDGGAPETPVNGIEPRDEPIQWSADGRALFVREAGDFATKLYRVEIASGRRRMWREIVPPNPIGLVGIEAKPGGIVITPDGKVCVYTYWTTLHELLLMDEFMTSQGIH
jgi:serine/threonine protein kinase/Tol biopolymer transport system component